MSRVNVMGGSGNEEERGSWCTPKWIADLLGRVDLDPCSNPRSHVRARYEVCLTVGLKGGTTGMIGEPGWFVHDPSTAWKKALDDWDVFVNPPYERGSVIQWVRHYRHTNFTFLLKWDPSTEWFAELISHCHYVWFPFGERIAFEPPPGVKTSSNPFPHALYLRNPPRDRFERLKAKGLMLTVDDENVRLLAAVE